MNETTQKIVSNVKSLLDQSGRGAFTVSLRNLDAAGGAVYIGSNPDNKIQTLKFIIQNDGLETDTIVQAKKLLAETFSRLTPLVPYIDFAAAEPVKDHLHHLAEKFEGIRAKAATAGLVISDVPGQWLKEREKLEALKDSATGYVTETGDHAITVERTDTSIIAHFRIPSGVSTDDVQKEFLKNEAAVKTLLARMTAKKLTKNPEEQAKIIEQDKALDMVPTVQSYDNYSHLNIEFRSPEVTKAMKEPGGLQAATKEKLEELKASNPLMKLKDGDGLTQENPADLKKALARAILFEGEKGEKPIALFAKMAGRQDVKRLMEKSLEYIKKSKPELAADVDTLLKDKLFEETNYEATKNKDGSPKKQDIDIKKREGEPYIEGQYTVTLAIPTDKFTEVLGQLAGLGQQPAPVIATASAPAAGIVDSTVEMGAALAPVDQTKALQAALAKVIGDNKAAIG
jgi:hypothetical protein